MFDGIRWLGVYFTTTELSTVICFHLNSNNPIPASVIKSQDDYMYAIMVAAKMYSDIKAWNVVNVLLPCGRAAPLLAFLYCDASTQWPMGCWVSLFWWTLSQPRCATNRGIWDQASTVSGSTAAQSIILNEWNDIIVRSYKVICEAHDDAFKLLYFVCCFPLTTAN